jgi:sugar lactone lactonase YvrE
VLVSNGDAPAMPRRLTADPANEFVTELGEGPQWDARSRTLSWVDLVGGRLYACDEDGTSSWDVLLDAPLGAALPTGDGPYLLADTVGVRLLSADGKLTPLVDMFSTRPHLRCNDAKTDPVGRAWIDVVDRELRPQQGSLCLLTPEPSGRPELLVREVKTRLTVPNGMDWSPDGSTMWFADSERPEITGYSYDVDAGCIGPERATVQMRDGDVPDGLCVDDEGCIWVALWNRHAVHRYTPTGRLDTVVDVPAARVTSCTFGGTDLGTLFITTGFVGQSDEDRSRFPESGRLFTVRPGTTGRAAVPWQVAGELVDRGTESVTSSPEMQEGPC